MGSLPKPSFTPSPGKTVWSIDVGYACYGLIEQDGRVKQTAPIANWMTGKTLTEVWGWLAKKNAKVEQCQLLT